MKLSILWVSTLQLKASHAFSNLPFTSSTNVAFSVINTNHAPRDLTKTTLYESSVTVETANDEVDYNIHIPSFPHVSSPKDKNNNSDEAEELDIDWLTNMLLDTKNYPKGSLSVDVLYTINYVMDKWAKCGLGEEGAILVQHILQRTLDEHKAGNRVAKEVINAKLYTVVCCVFKKILH